MPPSMLLMSRTKCTKMSLFIIAQGQHDVVRLNVSSTVAETVMNVTVSIDSTLSSHGCSARKLILLSNHGYN